MDNKYDALKLENQLCFPLYAAARETMKLYTPYLDKVDLTYTQYICIMLLWENKSMTVKDMGKRLYLDSGTLTPLLKKLEAKGFVTRSRSVEDERNLIVAITEKGESLKDDVVDIPCEMEKLVVLNHEERVQLYRLLYKLLSILE